LNDVWNEAVPEFIPKEEGRKRCEGLLKTFNKAGKGVNRKALSAIVIDL